MVREGEIAKGLVGGPFCEFPLVAGATGSAFTRCPPGESPVNTGEDGQSLIRLPLSSFVTCSEYCSGVQPTCRTSSVQSPGIVTA